MDKLVIVSDEPALGEILAAELKTCEVLCVRRLEGLPLHDVSLVIVDNANGITKPSEAAHYMTLKRPIRLEELLYTICERLQVKSLPLHEETLLVGNCRLSVRERMLTPQGEGEAVPLTEKEIELLATLVNNKEKTMSKEELLMCVWGYGEAIDTHTLETHIYRLRGKIKQVNAMFDITSVEGEGYKVTYFQK